MEKYLEKIEVNKNNTNQMYLEVICVSKSPERELIVSGGSADCAKMRTKKGPLCVTAARHKTKTLKIITSIHLVTNLRQRQCEGLIRIFHFLISSLSYLRSLSGG